MTHWDPQPGVLTRQRYDGMRYRSPYLFEFEARDGFVRDRDSGLLLSRSNHEGTFSRTVTKTAIDSVAASYTVPPMVPAIQVTSGAAGLLLSSDDDLWWAWSVLPRAFELTIQFVDRNPGADEGIIYIGNAANSGARFWIEQGASVYEVHHDNGSVERTGLATGSVSTGQLVRLRAVLNADGSCQIWQSVDGAAETTGGVTASNTLASAWSDGRIYFNARGSGNEADSEIQFVRIAA